MEHVVDDASDGRCDEEGWQMAMVCDVAFTPLSRLTNLHPAISLPVFSTTYQMHD